MFPLRLEAPCWLEYVLFIRQKTFCLSPWLLLNFHIQKIQCLMTFFFCLQQCVFVDRFLESTYGGLDFSDLLLAPINLHLSLWTKTFHHARDFFLCLAVHLVAQNVQQFLQMLRIIFSCSRPSVCWASSFLACRPVSVNWAMELADWFIPKSDPQYVPKLYICRHNLLFGGYSRKWTCHLGPQ